MSKKTFVNVKYLPSHLSAHIQLEYVKSQLDQIDGTLAIRVPTSIPDTCRETIKKLRADIKDALEKLKRPRLRLGFAGTTSSGKSTMSNAVIGRELLPMDSRETSTGVVQIFHDETMGDKVRVVLHPPKYATRERERLERGGKKITLWESYDKVFESDEEVRNALNSVMKKCRALIEEDKMATLEQCHFEIYARILPGIERSLIKMPQGVEFEIVDLPGINLSNDENSKFINGILKSLTTVVLIDYHDAATKIGKLKNGEHALGSLIAEVDKIVSRSGGDASNIIFVLNRVDKHNQNDPTSVEDVIGLLQNELKIRLNLKNEPMIFPTCTALVESIQTGFGIDTNFSSGKDLSDEDISRIANGFHYATGAMSIYNLSDEKWFKDLRTTCIDTYDSIGALAQAMHAKTSSLSEEEIQCLKKNIAEGLIAIRETLVKKDSRHDRKKLIIRRARDKSGFSAVITDLNQRVSESFASLVIRPIIANVWEELTNHIDSIQTACKITIDGIDENLDGLIKRLDSLQFEVERTINEYTKMFNKELQEVSNLMRDRSGESRSKLAEYAVKSAFFSAIKRILNLVDRIERDCSDYVIAPIKSYLGSSSSDQQLLTQLSSTNISLAKVNRLCRSIEPLRGYGSYESGGKKTFDKYSYNVDRYNRLRDAINKCHEIIPELLASYYSFQMQINQTTLESVMKEIATTIRTALIKRLRTVVVDAQESHQLVDSLVPSVAFLARNVDLTFPNHYLKNPKLVAKAKEWVEHTTEQIITLGDGVKNVGTFLGNRVKDAKTGVKRVGAAIWNWFTGDDVEVEPEEYGKYQYTTKHNYEDKVTFDMPAADSLVKEWETCHINARSGLISLADAWLMQNGLFFLTSFKEACQEKLDDYSKMCASRVKVEGERAEKVKKEIMDFSQQLNAIADYRESDNERVLVDGHYYMIDNLVTRGQIEQNYQIEFTSNSDNELVNSEIL